MTHRPSRSDRRAPTAGPAAVAALLAVSCSACPSSPAAGADAGSDTCTYESCERACRASGMCFGSCNGGTCGCGCAGDADGRSEVDEARTEALDGEDVPADVRPDEASSDGGECEIRVEPETRPGASPGVTCMRISADDVEYALIFFDGDGDRILGSGGDQPGEGVDLWEFRRSATCLHVIERGESPIGGFADPGWVAVDGGKAGYRFQWTPHAGAETCELRLRDLETGELRILDTNTSANRDSGDPGCYITHVALEYPWVAWRDIRERPPGGTRVIAYQPNALAINAETGELLNLSLDPETGDQRVGGTDRVDLAGGLVVIGADWMISEPYPGRYFKEVVAFDLVTRTRTQITDAIGDQYKPTVTDGWIVWADQRNAPSYDWFWPCHGDIYGYDRTTGEEVPLVAEGEVLHGPNPDAEGPWLVYNDQRWGPEPECDTDDEQDIVAMHLPTRTEIRITDWPGMEGGARMYDRRDGTYGVLLIADVDGHNHRLWDCDLPEPGKEGR